MIRVKFLTFILLGFLTSCNFRPQYDRPCMALPETWRFPADAASGDLINMRWWEQFGDSTLNELIALALVNNEDLQAATCRVIQFYSRYRIIASILYPQLFGDAGLERQELSEGLSFSPVIPGTRYNSLYNLGLNLSYEIDFWSKYRNATEAARSLYLSEVEARRTIVLTLVSSLAQSYILLRQLEAQLKIAQDTYVSRLEALRIISLRYDIGLVSAMEVEQATSQLEIAQIQIKEYEKIIPQQEDLICTLVGVPPNKICAGKDLDDLYILPTIPAGIPSDILCNRPDVLQAEYQILAANAEIGVARAAFFPNISLTSLFGYQSTSLNQLLRSGSQAWDWNVSALQPFFTGWRLTYQLVDAASTKCSAIHNYKNTILQALQEVSDSLIAHQKSQEIVETEKKLVDALAMYLKLSILRYDNGENDYLTVINAETSLFDAQLDLARARSDVLLTMVEIYKSLGGGWVIDADENFTEHEMSFIVP